MFVDCHNFAGSWVIGFLHNNARQFITLLNLPGDENSWVRVTNEIHEHQPTINKVDSTVYRETKYAHIVKWCFKIVWLHGLKQYGGNRLDSFCLRWLCLVFQACQALWPTHLGTCPCQTQLPVQRRPPPSNNPWAGSHSNRYRRRWRHQWRLMSSRWPRRTSPQSRIYRKWPLRWRSPPKKSPLSHHLPNRNQPSLPPHRLLIVMTKC